MSPPLNSPESVEERKRYQRRTFYENAGYDEPRRGDILSRHQGAVDLGALFDGHIAREFADFDVDATMETMVAEPYVHCVATLAGGFGGQEVRRFYSEHFINQIPKDAKVTPISRTIGRDQVVDELM